MASRRALNSTDETNYSLNSETRHDAELARQYVMASELEAIADYSTIIKRSLSVNTVVSTISSFAQRSQLAASHSDLQKIIQIGAGMQGVMFEQVGYCTCNS
jgi:hypothetical protein